MMERIAKWLSRGSSLSVASDYVGTPLPYPWGRRNWRTIVATSLSTALVVMAGAIVWTLDPWNPCGIGLNSEGSVCVGLNLSSANFQKIDPLSALERTIARDNAKITGTKYVTIVYLGDMTANPEENSDSVSEAKNEVEGAITAERAVNDSAIAGLEVPKIKLLLANYGDSGESWRVTVSRILESENSQHIVAVTGFGQGTLATRQAILDLSQHGITSIGANTSADDMGRDVSGRSTSNFFRVAPTVQNEARSAASFIQGKNYKRVMLIQDVDPEDDYGRDLATDFKVGVKEGYPGLQIDSEYFQSPSSALTGVTRSQYMTHQFANMYSDICRASPDLIYFAGRGADLRSFLTALSGSGACGLRHVDVLTGDDAGAQAGIPLPSSGSISFNVFYTAGATAGEWNLAPGDVVDRLDYQQFLEEFTSQSHFAANDLTDGQAMLEYDALLTAATAARRDPAAIRNPSTLPFFVANLDCHDPVPGAGGRIAFSGKDGPGAGRGIPVDMAIPIMRIMPNGGFTQQALDWSEGKPFDDPSVCG